MEYLLLMAVAFITAYIMITGPVSSFTIGMIQTLSAAMGNIVQNGDLKTGQVVPPGQSGHPSDPSRLKRVH